MRKGYSIFIVVLFTAFLGVFFMLHWVTPDRGFSETENRALEQCPVLSLQTVSDGSFMQSFQTYATDQFPLRQQWIGGKAWLERLSGKQENHEVYFAGDRLIADFQIEDSTLVSNNINYVNQFAVAAELDVYVSLIPNPAYLWSDWLPAGAPVDDQGAVLAALESCPGYYSTASVLAEHRAEDIYYRTDHHWTSLGAYYGYVALADALGMEATPLENYSYTVVSTDFYGTSARRAAAEWILPDEIGYYVPEEYPGQLYDFDRLSTADQYSFFLGGNAAVRVVKTEQEKAPKLLLLRDSHADSLVPFLTPHFSEIHLIDLRYYKQSVTAYAQEQGISQVVILYGVSNFTEDTNLFVLSMD